MYQRFKNPSLRAIAKPYRFVQLPMQVDVAPMIEEFMSTELTWLPSQWKWHLGTYFCILRAGKEGKYPGSALTGGADLDTPNLDKLPLIRKFLDTAFPVPVRLAWLGLIPQNTCIHLHTDDTDHWDEHHRIQIPMVTNPEARLCIEGRFQHLPAGTVWAINNSVPHGVLNTGSDRFHLMVDLPSTPEVDALIAVGTPALGQADAEALEQLSRDPMLALTDADLADSNLMARLMLQ